MRRLSFYRAAAQSVPSEESQCTTTCFSLAFFGIPTLPHGDAVEIYQDLAN